MHKIGILTDSTNDLPGEFIESREYLFTIPLTLHFGDEQYIDGVDIGSAEFFEKIEKEDIIPTTSQPSAGRFIEKYQEMAEDYDQIISIHISGKLSGTVKSAQLAAQDIENAEIKIIDTGSASLGLGTIVKLACKLVAEDKEFTEIADIIDAHLNKSTVLFTVSDLKFLEKGGRIGKAQSFLGSILNFHPLLELKSVDGEITPNGRARGKKRVKDAIVEYCQEWLQGENYAWIGIMHGNNPERAAEIKAALEDLCQELDVELEIIENIISPILGAHVGPSVYGMALLTGDSLK
ncbi:MAG: DegV family protein [Halarsenatibacteraceae bacterium]